jgi:hypothetical protein
VAPARFLDAKHGATARSALVNGGVGKVFWHLENIELPAEELRFLKVGENGENIRSYTACCGTLFNTAGGKQFSAPARPLTRNSVKAPDGSAYTPADPSLCTDCLTKYAFGDYELPTPSFEGGSEALSDGFAACGAGAMPDEVDPRWLKVNRRFYRPCSLLFSHFPGGFKVLKMSGWRRRHRGRVNHVGGSSSFPLRPSASGRQCDIPVHIH